MHWRAVPPWVSSVCLVSSQLTQVSLPVTGTEPILPAKWCICPRGCSPSPCPALSILPGLYDWTLDENNQKLYVKKKKINGYLPNTALLAMKCLTYTAGLQREKFFDCPFPIYHLPKVYSQEILISSLFVFGRFILVLHSYSKQRPFKML